MKSIKFSKIRTVKIPIRAHVYDAGIDFFIPHETLDSICLPPHTRICLPSGIKMNIPKGWALIAHNKSSIAHGIGIHTMADVIDSGYQGEIHISICNTTDYPVHIQPGQKIVQFILIPVGLHKLKQVPIKKLFNNKSKRSNRGFGSTGG